MSLPLPLEGVRILAVEQFGAGPFGTLYLADMGADVVKIEPPQGDSARMSGPHFLSENDSHFFQTFNRNKRSIVVDLKTAEGQAVLHRLVPRFDAVMNNLRGDQPDALGLTYEALCHLKPEIVCCHLSAYGRTGPRASWPGYDYLMQAEAGWMSVTGEPDGLPTRAGLSVVDYMTGITASLGLVSALLGAARNGRGRDVDVSLYDVAMHQLSYPATWYLNEGTVTGPRPRSGHPNFVPCEMMPTADGWVFVMCVLPKFFVALCEALGAPELPEDPRFNTQKGRKGNRDAMMEILDPLARTRTTSEWMEAFGGRVPAAPVLTIDKALDNPFFRERGGVRVAPHPLRPDFAMVASPIRTGADAPSNAGPAFGGQTDEVLGEAGYGAEEIAALKAAGTVR
ncbi:CoA transferase [Acuticoccus sediminis]|uniref:CoA transferase n=1 Tax=Acuticoccus sediminis TaxID=2184697 RepID=A0A8B2NJG0_9HYPH|nr:CoA transferase [Acuticoccus sediminis]RAH97782.1 CoA transferase [Acuticoccus sediminis]